MVTAFLRCDMGFTGIILKAIYLLLMLNVFANGQRQFTLPKNLFSSEIPKNMDSSPQLGDFSSPLSNPFDSPTFNPQPSNRQPFNSQPFNPQPSNRQPFNSQPFNSQPFNPELFKSPSFDPLPSIPQLSKPFQPQSPRHSPYNPQSPIFNPSNPYSPGFTPSNSQLTNFNPFVPNTPNRFDVPHPQSTRLSHSNPPPHQPQPPQPQPPQPQPSERQPSTIARSDNSDAPAARSAPETSRSNAATSPNSGSSSSSTADSSSSSAAGSPTTSSGSTGSGTSDSSAAAGSSSSAAAGSSSSAAAGSSSSPSDSSGASSSSSSTSGAPPKHPAVHHSSHPPASNSKSNQKTSSSSSERDPLRGLRIVCIFNNKHYLRSGFTPALIDPSLCTHVNYEFAMLDPKTYEMITGEPDLDIQQNFYQEAIDLRKINPKLKVLLSLGGWMDSTKKYSEMAADKARRTNFIEKAIAFLKAQEFDGLDLAWEYPNCWQGAIGVSPKDKDNFVYLLQEMRPMMDKNNLILSVSVGAIKREVEVAYDVPKISELVHYINVMTYDMHGPWESKTGHHTQFDAKEDDSDPYCNVKGGMRVWTEKGAEKKKLNMGFAFYGKTFTLVDPDQWWLGAPAKGIGKPGPDSNEGGLLLYNEICKYLNSGNWTEKEDSKVGFYAYSGDQWACYDPPLMVVRKSKYVVTSGFGGVLVKDLSGDDYKGVCFSSPFLLLKMIRLQMIRRVRA